MNALEMGRAVSAMTVDLLLSEDNPDEPFLVMMKPDFDTACWSFLPPHRIYIGDKCLGRAKQKLSEAELVAYLKAFFKHEVSHLRWSERNLDVVNTALQARGIPFALWNLFEDARIEHLERGRSGDLFGWAWYEEVVRPRAGAPIKPLSDFFRLIQLENEEREARAPVVVEFYDRAIAARTSLELIPVLVDWMRRFPGEVPPQRFSGEMETSLSIQSDARALADFEKGTFKPGSAPPKDTKAVEVAERKPSRLLDADEIHQVDFERAEKLAAKFLALFGSRTFTSRSDEPSSRISVRHLELDRPCYKRKVTVKTVAKRLCLVIDCSGSMDGRPIEEARLLAWALSYLASLGKIKGCLILSAVSGSTAVNELFELPISSEVAQRIHAFGDAEGLNSAILGNLTRLSDSDMVFVKTDGDIRDEPLNRREVERKGITVCGLYSGGVSNAAKMSQHFRRFFVRDSLESLIDALIQTRLN